MGVKIIEACFRDGICPLIFLFGGTCTIRLLHLGYGSIFDGKQILRLLNAISLHELHTAVGELATL